jgi:propionyl-CoA carboxylase alpha chain
VITTLLVANRGEIARRIFRTAAAMGIGTVAVYAEGDAGSPFVAEADRAVALPGRTAAQTYLNIEALLAAAAAAGADAVHPGYGFLSERAGFARAVTAAGLTWVGPPAEVIEVMGDKLAAKRLLADVGVPVLESWEVAGDDLPDLSSVPLPLIVKAAMGGGGKGMRVIGAGPGAADATAPDTTTSHGTKSDDAGGRGAALDTTIPYSTTSDSAGGAPGMAEAIAAARREAMAAFGDGRVFLERYVTGARHVEIQILADGHGGLVHCFERECSVQRRHQKIIEECPSPAVDAGLRHRMGAAALAAAKAIGYLGAGTVEFLLEPSGEFWFLEVNTRLQVEHPVTEAVTGVDLVREQLLVAQGLPLSVTQDGLAINGHAIEARLYAEDPAAGFLPSAGTLHDWAPAAAPPCRWESGVAAGGVVGVEFDPMLAKVIAHAPARTEAARALALALERSRIRGVTTNRDFLVAALRHPDFLAGRTTTAFIEASGVPLVRQPPEAELHTAAAGAALAAQAARRAAAPVLATLPSGWRNTVMPPERAEFRHGQDRLVVSYARQRNGRFAVTVTGAGPVPAGDPRPGEPMTVTGAGPVQAGDPGPGEPMTVTGAGPVPAGDPGPGEPGRASPGSPPTAASAATSAPAGWLVTVHHAGDGWIDFESEGRRHRLHVLAVGDQVWVQGPDGDVALTAVPRFPAAERGGAVAGGLVAPMPGTVLAVHVAPGEPVAAGQLVMIVEAMKMEHRITAPHAGTVTEVRARPGDQVSGGDLVAVLDGSI